MALDPKLRSGLTGNPVHGTPPVEEPISDSQQEAPIPAQPEQTLPTPPQPVPEPNPAPVPNPTPVPDKDPGYAALRASMERQFRGLQQSIADLQQDISSVQEPDLRGIVAKIESARASLEQQIASLGAAAAPKGGVPEDRFSQLEAMIQAVCDKQDRNDRQIAQTLRENANFQVQVRQNMQRELDGFRERQTGEQFNPLLKEISRMYVEYQSTLQDDSLSPQFRKNLDSLFEELADLLGEYDAEVCVSEVGSARRAKLSKVVGKIPTGDKDLHNTIARSRKPGVMRDRVVLYPEYVDVYVYDPTLEPPVPETPAEPEPEQPQPEPAVEPAPEAPVAEEPQTPADEPQAPAEDTPEAPEETNI